MIIAFPILHHFPIYSIDISITHDEIANLEIHILVKDIELASDKIVLYSHIQQVLCLLTYTSGTIKVKIRNVQIKKAQK